MEDSRCYRYTVDVQRMSQDAIVVHEMFNGGVEMLSWSTDEPRCYRYTLDVQQMSQDAIVVHEMFNGGFEVPGGSVGIISTVRDDWAPLPDSPVATQHEMPEVSIKSKGQRKVDTLDTFQQSQADWIRQYMEQQEEDEYESWEDTTDADDKLEGEFLQQVEEKFVVELTYHKVVPAARIFDLDSSTATLDIVWMLIFPSALDIVWILNFLAALDIVWVLNFPEPWKYELKLNP
ncbi:hypothetical protein Tco_0185317 [Tanacetum coccineum]